jgi:hypothetical protein
VVSWDVKSSVNYAVTLLRENEMVAGIRFNQRVSRTFFPFKFALTIRCFY